MRFIQVLVVEISKVIIKFVLTERSFAGNDPNLISCFSFGIICIGALEGQ